MNYINGKWITNASTGKTFKSINPANKDEVLGEFPLSGKEDVELAVASAKKAQKEWKKIPAPERGRLLFNIAKLMERDKELLAETITREMGKTFSESLGEVQVSIDMVYYSAGEGRRLIGETVPSEKRDKYIVYFREPVGVAGIITPWNFPLLLPVRKIMPALIAGNTVVFKPSRETPLVAQKFVKLLEEAGLPPGVINLIQGSGESVGMEIVRHPDVGVVSFTGSVETGRKIGAICGEQIKKVGLELGGKNPVIVLEDADMDLALEGCVSGAYGATGQKCTAASRIIVEEKVYNKFIDGFIERVKKIKVGNGMDKNTDMGPLVSESQLDKVKYYVELGIKEGARLAYGGNILSGNEFSKGFFFEPTVFIDVTPEMRIAREEIFGPVVCIMKAKDFDSAIEIANSTEFGLSASIYTKDLKKSFKAMGLLESGVVYVNAPPTGAEIQGLFGGIKASGNGEREQGTTAIDLFTEWKTVFIVLG
ncbi:aldehyde dehydrogenase family protein [bacterium]|nr:aldehyde dehydrogenase family protein [bacterium]